eukprot:81132-Chlamydomonas_euryale.AAC.1
MPSTMRTCHPPCAHAIHHAHKACEPPRTQSTTDTTRHTAIATHRNHEAPRAPGHMPPTIDTKSVSASKSSSSASSAASPPLVSVAIVGTLREDSCMDQGRGGRAGGQLH